jgi:hypothetical protein
MGFMIGLIVTTVGFILALAVHPDHPGSVNVNTVGWIMVVVGLIAFLADLVLWSSWGPGYLRRTYVDQGPGYGPGAYPGRWGGFGRRRVIEEEEGGGPGPRY